MNPKTRSEHVAEFGSCLGNERGKDTVIAKLKGILFVSVTIKVKKSAVV
jgi:hypothetical protein